MRRWIGKAELGAVGRIEGSLVDGRVTAHVDQDLQATARGGGRIAPWIDAAAADQRDQQRRLRDAQVRRRPAKVDARGRLDADDTVWKLSACGNRSTVAAAPAYRP